MKNFIYAIALMFFTNTYAQSERDRVVGVSNFFDFGLAIDYSADFLQNDKLTRDSWISNPGNFYDAPKSIDDSEFDAAIYYLHQQVFDLMKSERLSASYEACKKNALNHYLGSVNLIRQEAASSQLADVRERKIKIANEVEQVAPIWAPSQCAFRVIRRGLLKLNVPNYFPEQNRALGPTISYENLYIGQIYRFVHAVKNKKFTNLFYENLANEMNLDYKSWFEGEFSQKSKSNDFPVIRLTSEQKLIVSKGYVQNIDNISYGIKIKRVFP